MKKSIILWIAALIITFLAGFTQNRLSPYYPISGTIGIEGKKVSYKFDKLYRGNEEYKITILSDLNNSKGYLEWRNTSSNSKWNMVKLIPSNNHKLLTASIPVQAPFTRLEYRVNLQYNERSFILPGNASVPILFLGKVSPQIMFWYYLTLLGGLLLSTRAGLEYFKENGKIKTLAIFTVILFFVNAFAFSPVKRSYEYGSIGTKILSIHGIFSTGPILLFLVWLITLILIFNIKGSKILAVISAIIVILLYQLTGFY